MILSENYETHMFFLYKVLGITLIKEEESLFSLFGYKQKRKKIMLHYFVDSCINKRIIFISNLTLYEFFMILLQSYRKKCLSRWIKFEKHLIQSRNVKSVIILHHHVTLLYQ